MVARMPLRRIGFIVFLGALRLRPPGLGANPSAPPPKVDQLIKLLADPTVKEWLSQQVQTTNPPPGTAPAGAGPEANPQGMQPSMVSTALHRIKQHLERVAMAWPGLPAKYERTSDIIMVEFADRGVIGIALLIAFFIAVGVGLAYLAFRLTRPLRLWIIALPHETPQGRLKKLGGRSPCADPGRRLHGWQRRRIPDVRMAALAARDRASLYLRPLLSYGP